MQNVWRETKCIIVYCVLWYYGRRANDELHFYCNADDHVRKFIAWERRCDRINELFRFS